MIAMLVAAGVFSLTLPVLAVLAIAWLIQNLRPPAGSTEQRWADTTPIDGSPRPKER